jgi:3,4-dihydroxybenzoyl-citryl-spermidine/N-citryl-spermidine--spermidine ligase
MGSWKLPDRRVLRQLVEALLYERVASWSSELAPPEVGGVRALSFRLGSASYCCRARVGAFGRVRVVEGSIGKVGRYTPRETTWREVLGDVPAAAAVKQAIADELASTARLCRWNLQNLPALQRSRRGLPYEELERLLHEGHPYHPCFKSRSGFSLEDHAAYGPEAGESFELRWLAVQRGRLAQVLPTDEAEHWHAELGPEAASALAEAREAAGTGVEQYGLLPVHPWQWRHLSESPALRAALARREVVDLRVERGRYRATQSVRTLLPARVGASHLKVPLALRISSSLRTLEPETVKAAPAVSGWLRSLVAADPFFEEVAGVVVLAEHASSSYEPSCADTAPLDGNLAAIWRAPIGPCLRPHEEAMPYNALFATEPDGLPHVDPWIRQYGLTAWVSRVLRVTLLPLWRLVSHHGVALEAHAQNLLLLHEDGWPTRVAVRDFHDSVEYVPSFLAAPDRVPRWASLDRRFADAPPGRHYAMQSVVELRDLFIDAVLVFNLCELSWLMEQSYGFREADFWRLARTILTEYSRSAWCSPEREATLALRAPFVHTESLFKARLRASLATLHRHLVPNALGEHADRETHADHQ